ncbi:Dolichyl-phosphate-mannose-protein mannosyltransferase [Singulisphaera sp. GP187]|uniref:glycosyltransferase family 39 protein n=1 Tax=Singulisphaera sp. GP187 TaxID=1882752 RepID=UPI00092C8A3F|nr:glycosyltransferase family 39 protein [Singulisphaera sp. GP187]SIO56334.1 Dolichyl-phosphate-mannose-protein mannosyltransferase [Singulisphaera sp. GP187]
MSQRHVLIAMLLILAAGVATRCQGMAERTLSFDEAFSWRLVTANPALEIVQRTAADVHPPLYYLLLKLWTGLLGDGPVALRSLSVCLAGASLVLVYGLTRDIFRWASKVPDEDSARAAGVVAMLLTATSGAHIRWSGEARMYSLACLLGLASTWLLARGILGPARSRRGSSALWSLYALSACLSMYTHNYMLFVVAAQGAWLLLFGFAPAAGGADPAVSPRRRQLAGFAALAVAIAGYAPWVPVLLWQTDQVGHGYWFSRPSAFEISRGWADLLVPRNQLQWGDNWAAGWLAALSGAIVAGLAIAGRRGGALIAALIAASILIPVTITLYYGTAIVNNQTSRYWLVPFVFFLIGVSVLLCRVLAGAERWLFVAILVANNVYWWAEFTHQTRLDLMGGAKALVEYVHTHGDSDEPIVVREPSAYLRILYYLRNDPGRERLHFLPKGPLAQYNGGPVILEGEIKDVDILDPWVDRKVWAVDGSTLVMLLNEAHLPEPWAPVGRSEIFPEPILTNGKLALTESVFRKPAPRP